MILDTLKIGDKFFSIEEKEWYTVIRIDKENNQFAYSYQTEAGVTRTSFWIDLDDKRLIDNLENGDIILSQSEHERLVIDLKHSS